MLLRNVKVGETTKELMVVEGTLLRRKEASLVIRRLSKMRGVMTQNLSSRALCLFYSLSPRTKVIVGLDLVNEHAFHY